VSEDRPLLPDLQSLVDLFYDDSDQLGRLTNVGTTEMPAAYQTLLAHQNHMTVTVEHFHRSPVDVRVLATRLTLDHYARKILLSRQTDGRVVQFGIVRLDFRYLSTAVRAAIESQGAPLGRILIEHNVLREVHLSHLWRVEAGPDLASLLDVPAGSITYGRTAIIDCNAEPAVELLEIVTPVTPAH
jgi:chorismate-pyruvate lyase